MIKHPPEYLSVFQKELKITLSEESITFILGNGKKLLEATSWEEIFTQLKNPYSEYSRPLYMLFEMDLNNIPLNVNEDDDILKAIVSYRLKMHI